MTPPQTKKKTKARLIKPPNILKQKAGSGGIDKKLLEKAQDFIQDIPFDFRPIAAKFIEQIDQAAKTALKTPENFKDTKEELVKPIMQLKANGAMFKFSLISDVADSALRFIETLTIFNKDAYNILKAYQNTLGMIIQNNLTGSGGKEGDALIKELEKASKRYFQKHKK